MDEVYLSDSYGAVFEWTQPDDENPNVSIAANPSTATFSIVRARTGETVTLEDDDATISGNETTAVVPAGVLTRVGNYSLYMTAVFADGTTRTRSRPFRVMAKDGLN